MRHEIHNEDAARRAFLPPVVSVIRFNPDSLLTGSPEEPFGADQLWGMLTG